MLYFAAYVKSMMVTTVEHIWTYCYMERLVKSLPINVYVNDDRMIPYKVQVL